MRIDTLETSSLGDRSYLASDGDVAVVIDPQRDIDRIHDLVRRSGARVTHVAETHVHNDYVSGGLELSRRTGAHYLLPVGSEIEFEHRPVADREELEIGAMRLRVLHTPGHTYHHVSYAISDTSGLGRAVFTGGSMLFAATGRTDLVSPQATEELTHAQFHSVRRVARALPADTEVLPTHGFGSFCSATPTSGSASTIGEQRTVNPALTMAEQQYVDTLLAGLDAHPAYYHQMGPINRRGPAPIDLSLPRLVDPTELRRRLAAGEWVVDLRERRAFAAGHLAGSLAMELSTNFATYLGWLYRYGTPLTLVGESEEQLLEARRELARIGIDELAGASSKAVETLTGGQPLRSYPVMDFAGLADAMRQHPVQVLDARRNDERARGYVRDSLHVPLHELAERPHEVPDGEVWVYCGSGYRASIAASLLDRPGRQVVLINDSYEAAIAAGLDGRASAPSAGQPAEKRSFGG